MQANLHTSPFAASTSDTASNTTSTIADDMTSDAVSAEAEQRLAMAPAADLRWLGVWACESVRASACGSAGEAAVAAAA